MADGWHEDFEDSPSVEERYPDDGFERDDWFGYEDYDRDDYPEDDWDDGDDGELDSDRLLERQELEDYEGLNGPFEDREYEGE